MEIEPQQSSMLEEYKLENLYNLEGGYNAIMQEEYESSKLDFILITLKGLQ